MNIKMQLLYKLFKLYSFPSFTCCLIALLYPVHQAVGAIEAVSLNDLKKRIEQLNPNLQCQIMSYVLHDEKLYDWLCKKITRDYACGIRSMPLSNENNGSSIQAFQDALKIKTSVGVFRLKKNRHNGYELFLNEFNKEQEIEISLFSNSSYTNMYIPNKQYVYGEGFLGKHDFFTERSSPSHLNDYPNWEVFKKSFFLESKNGKYAVLGFAGKLKSDAVYETLITTTIDLVKKSANFFTSNGCNFLGRNRILIAENGASFTTHISKHSWYFTLNASSGWYTNETKCALFPEESFCGSEFLDPRKVLSHGQKTCEQNVLDQEICEVFKKEAFLRLVRSYMNNFTLGVSFYKKYYHEHKKISNVCDHTSLFFKQSFSCSGERGKKNLNFRDC